MKHLNENEPDAFQSGVNQPSEGLLEEAAAYFRARPGFQRFLDALVEKYIHLGRLGGTIVLGNVSREERETLEMFLRRKLSGEPLKLVVSRFEWALSQTRFGSLDLVAILEAWYGRSLVTQEEYREKSEKERRAMVERLMATYPQAPCQEWLGAILNKEPQTRLIQRAMTRDAGFEEDIRIALEALADLPGEYQRLPIFARRICGDPHGLDLDREAGRLFVEGLRYLQSGGEKASGANDFRMLSAVEEFNELMYQFKLLRDDLLNLATCFGLIAAGAEGEITYWKAAAASGAPLNVPLREIVRVKAFYPWLGREASPTKNSNEFAVSIVENSGIFSALLDECASCHPQLVCLQGQFKLASWALLDRMIQSQAVLHYSGDFDPEGLQMAEKLIKRYPGRVRLWRMTATDYLRAEPSVPLEASRLNKLKLITSPELRPLADCIAVKRLAAYQEGILEFLIRDIQNIDSRFYIG